MRISLTTTFFYLFLGLSGTLSSQTNPAAQTLTYSENFSALASTSTTYPSGIQGWKTGTAGVTTFRTTAPTVDQALVASGNASSSTGGIYNYNGKIGFLTSGSIDVALCFSISTTGLNGVTVNYDAMTIRNPYDGVTNTRINDVTLQYRLGTSGNFTNITGYNYQNNTTTQTGTVTTPQNVQSFSILLPTSCDNQAVVQLRWVTQETSGGGSRPSFAFDNIFVSSCTTNTSTYYYRSRQTGNWSVYSTWEASLNGVTGWAMACSPPTSAAAAITILSGHTVTINTNATAPNLTIDGTLIFDNVPRAVSVTNYITISSFGIFSAQAAGTATHTLSIGGDLTNNGTFDMANGGTTIRVCNVTFTKNGNQNVTGTGTTTRFNYIGLNMGTSNSNVLDISTSFFSAASSFLHPVATSPNLLANGTLKLSGTFAFSGSFFKTGAYYNIVSTAAIWINNPNVTINGTTDSYDVSGILKISAGTFTVGSCVRLLTGGKMIVQGGTVNVKGRIQSLDGTNVIQTNVTYNQSGGIVNLCTGGANPTSSPLIADFELDDTSDSLIFSGGTMVFRNEATNADDLYNGATSVITGGLIQIADALTTAPTAAGYYIESYGALPSISIYPLNSTILVVLATNLTVKGNINIGNATTLNNKWGTSIQTYNITLSGNWINNGTFLHNNLKTVTFNGSSAQTISGTSATTFNNLTINNSSGGVTLASPASVIASLKLSSGFLYTDATNILSMSASSSVGAVSNSSFVYGPMEKTGTTNFVFPVGKDLEYRPIAISSLSGSETFHAEYFHIDPSTLYSLASMDPTLTHIDGCEYWMLSAAGSNSALVTLSWDTYSCGVTSLPDLAVARFDMGTSTWKDEGNGGASGTTSTGTIPTAAIQTIYGPYTLGSHVANENPLPVELLSFTATYNENLVNLKWSTASELNNDHFEVERSADGTEFKKIISKRGAGNSTHQIDYSDADHEPLNGTSYYRLKQVDYDGQYKYSAIVSVSIEKNNFGIVSVSKSNDNLNIEFTCSDNCVLSLELYDMSGKKVISYKPGLAGNTSVSVPLSSLSSGIYLLRATDGDKFISKKISL